MPYSSRSPDSNGSQAAYQLPHPRNLAMLLLAALVILWALRHVYGALSVSAGTK